MYLENIKNPQDIKTFSDEQLEKLADEMRELLIKKVSKHGGHFGPNLGMVEATIALHYVFDSPKDKMVYDVSHQTYCHKMLTGRAYGFLDENRYDDITGYSCPEESEHDFFTVGHTSTSISLASGLVKARELKKEQGNVIAIIGDGSLSGGEALEGLNVAAELDSNFIIIVNDNDMSIAENHGGLYGNLKLLRDTDGKAECNLFKAVGLDYVFVKNGNDIQELIKAFNLVKDSIKPVVVHICTQKGMGYKPAQDDRETFHWTMPFDVKTGKVTVNFSGEDYGTLTADYLLEKMKKDEKVVAITAGTPAVMGFIPEKRKLAGKQFVDVGIAEETAVAMASGIAKGGAKPVFGVYSTFMQRTYDQIAQDLCINKNPATIVVFCASIYGMSDVTHVGFNDIPMISNIPELVYLAPTSKEEYFAMLDWSIEQNKYSVAIRVPENGVISSDIKVKTDYSELNKYQVVEEGSKIAIIAVGGFFELGKQCSNELENKLGVKPTLINPIYLTGLDDELLANLKANHDIVITLEDGIIEGGFGQKIASYYGKDGMKVLNYGLKKQLYDRYDVNAVLEENHLTSSQIAEDVKNIL